MQGVDNAQRGTGLPGGLRVVLPGNGYIFSQSARKATGGLKSWVLDDAGYEGSASGSFKLKSRVSEKAVYVADEDGKRRRVMVPVNKACSTG